MKTLNFNPFPALSTERLNLRRLTPDDEYEIFLLRSDLKVLEYLDRAACTKIDEAREFIDKISQGILNNESIYWAINLKTDPALIGTICLWNFSEDKMKADLGYELLPDYQGNGYITEAIESVLDYGFNHLQLSIIEAEVDPRNTRSVKLLEKYNFIRIAQPDNITGKDGNPLPTVIYSLSSDKLAT